MHWCNYLKNMTTSPLGPPKLLFIDPRSYWEHPIKRMRRLIFLKTSISFLSSLWWGLHMWSGIHQMDRQNLMKYAASNTVARILLIFILNPWTMTCQTWSMRVWIIHSTKTDPLFLQPCFSSFFPSLKIFRGQSKVLWRAWQLLAIMDQLCTT